MNNKKGFSIIRVLVVVGIIVVLALGIYFYSGRLWEKGFEIYKKELAERIPTEEEAKIIKNFLTEEIKTKSQETPNLKERLKEIELDPFTREIYLDTLQRYELSFKRGIMVSEKGLIECCQEELENYLKIKKLESDLKEEEEAKKKDLEKISDMEKLVSALEKYAKDKKECPGIPPVEPGSGRNQYYVLKTNLKNYLPDFPFDEKSKDYRYYISKDSQRCLIETVLKNYHSVLDGDIDYWPRGYETSILCEDKELREEGGRYCLEVKVQ